MEETSVRRRFARKPRILVGTFVGTIASYLFFVYHYTHEQDDDGAHSFGRPTICLARCLLCGTPCSVARAAG